LASTIGPGIAHTHFGLILQLTTELDYDLFTVEKSNLQGQQVDKQEGKSFYSPESFHSLYITI
jgi:hypothetical protein